MSEPLIRHVSDTAFLIAQCRAIESARPDALFKDPLAARLAGEKGRALVETYPTAAVTSWGMAIRTVVIDDLVREAIARGADTVLNLGAGLDTRPYRLELPRALRWIEADYPNVIAFKEERLAGEAPRCELERVGIDLADTAARRALLTRVDTEAERLLVLTEGLVPYLDLEQAGMLADDLRALERVDGWIVDYLSPGSHAYRRRAGVMKYMRQAPFKFQPSDWFGFFAEHGWRSREVRYLADEGARLGRPAPLPRPLFARLLRPLLPKGRRERFRRFTAYVLLEPAEREA